MSGVVDWLKNAGNSAVDVLRSPAANVIRDFSTAADKLARENNRWNAARESYARAGRDFPFQKDAAALLAQVVKNRAIKISLLKAMAKANANPKDYGLSIFDLSKTEIESAYPGLKFAVTDSRLGAAPVVVISAAVLLAVAAATAASLSLFKSASQTNFAANLTAEFIKAGDPPDVAAKKASVALKAVTDAGGTTFSQDIATTAKWVVGGILLILILSRVG